MKTNIEAIMITKVVTVTPATGFDEITGLMSQAKQSCLLVIDDDKPAGIVTERDIVRFVNSLMQKAQASELKSMSANDIMSNELITVNKESSLLDALKICIEKKVRHLPVIDNDKLSGLVTYTDIANELLNVNLRLQEDAIIDPLMKIGNRRAMENDLSAIHRLSVRHDDFYSVLMIDVDFFKKYNDHYGHQAGDETLKIIASSVREALRITDNVYRYGGEELLVLLPKTDVKGAVVIANKIRKRIVSKQIQHCESQFEVVTVSIGIAKFKKDGDLKEWNDVVLHADENLYLAKKHGRNRVVS